MAFTTYGELRRQLDLEGIKWTVNPNVPDTPIRHPSLGADLTAFPQAKDITAPSRTRPLR